MEKEKAVELFNKHNYQRAREIFGKLKSKVRDPRPYSILYQLSLGYEQWELFNYRGAKKNLEQAVEEAKQYEMSNLVDLNRLKANLEALSVLSKNITKSFLELLKDDDSALNLMVDIYCNAEREADRGYYDNAIVKLYRVLELISQYRLAKHDIDTSEVDIRSIPDKVKAKFRELAERLYGQPQDIPLKIGLVDGYILLAALESFEESKLNEVKEASQTRNRLMIAHGKEVGDGKTYDQLKKVVQKYLRETVGERLNDFKRKHTHMSFERAKTGT